MDDHNPTQIGRIRRFMDRIMDLLVTYFTVFHYIISAILICAEITKHTVFLKFRSTVPDMTGIVFYKTMTSAICLISKEVVIRAVGLGFPHGRKPIRILTIASITLLFVAAFRTAKDKRWADENPYSQAVILRLYNDTVSHAVDFSMKLVTEFVDALKKVIERRKKKKEKAGGDTSALMVHDQHVFIDSEVVGKDKAFARRVVFEMGGHPFFRWSSDVVDIYIGIGVNGVRYQEALRCNMQVQTLEWLRAEAARFGLEE
ncbi:hypothetical protein BJ508DRAFT_340285 [Ascobolus immersus RN42]|uniref:Uncharacterized protein n=1 Tax=Ascobolus immersus RN42 TaxID=1160509 RepID=A0A3N4IFT4_ASCIM|nr:hypothetical protein BJ508DRAFT_340285 [Ascobolus immersus RN42]